MGDVVLVETARAINRCLRRGDICARMGGEEFLVICPNTDVEGAWYAAERIRTTIEANHIKFGDFDGHVTVSLGIGPGNDRAGSIDELLKIADRAVYVSKGSGRNRATLGFPAPGSERESA